MLDVLWQWRQGPPEPKWPRARAPAATSDASCLFGLRRAQSLAALPPLCCIQRSLPTVSRQGWSGATCRNAKAAAACITEGMGGFHATPADRRERRAARGAAPQSIAAAVADAAARTAAAAACPGAAVAPARCSLAHQHGRPNRCGKTAPPLFSRVCQGKQRSCVLTWQPSAL